MVMNGVTPVTLYIVSAFVSAVAFIGLYRYWDGAVPLRYHLIHFFVEMGAGMMYVNFLGDSVLADVAWYLDWMVSTPLILTALTLTAFYESDDINWDLLGALVGLQCMVIVSGIVAQLTGQVYAFWIGTALLFGVIYLLWGPVRTIAMERGSVLGRQYTRLAAYISVLFLLYPAVWYLGEPGPLGALTAPQTTLAFVILPFLCKQLFGFLDLYLLKQVAASA